MDVPLPLTHCAPHLVYLLHFEPSVGGKSHYLGITRTDQFKRRMREHANGNGARLLRAAAALGSSFYVVRRWENASFAFERSLKNRGHAAQLCPLCNPRIARSGAWEILKCETEPQHPTDWKELTWAHACGPWLI